MAATVKQDFFNGGLMALSGANCISRVGGSNDTVNNNATITLLANAIEALAPVAGSSPDLNFKVAEGLRIGVLAGVVDETHTATTIAGLVAIIAANVPGVDSSFDGFLPQ